MDNTRIIKCANYIREVADGFDDMSGSERHTALSTVQSIIDEIVEESFTADETTRKMLDRLENVAVRCKDCCVDKMQVSN
jgi:hypothetical protein